MSAEGVKCRACGRKLADSDPLCFLEPACEVCLAQLDYLMERAVFIRDMMRCAATTASNVNARS